MVAVGGDGGFQSAAVDVSFVSLLPQRSADGAWCNNVSTPIDAGNQSLLLSLPRFSFSSLSLSLQF